MSSAALSPAHTGHGRWVDTPALDRSEPADTTAPAGAARRWLRWRKWGAERSHMSPARAGAGHSDHVGESCAPHPYKNGHYSSQASGVKLSTIPYRSSGVSVGSAVAVALGLGVLVGGSDVAGAGMLVAGGGSVGWMTTVWSGCLLGDDKSVI